MKKMLLSKSCIFVIASAVVELVEPCRNNERSNLALSVTAEMFIHTNLDNNT
jgi:hypothetical protein